MPATITPPAINTVDGRAVVIAKEDLPSLTAAITFAQEEIDEIGRKAMRQALPLKLQQGLCCLKARHLFGAEISNPTGRNQHSPELESDSDSTSTTPASFADWINGQPLPKATAYDYMKAVEGLKLDHTASPADVLAAYQAAAREGDLSIAKLKNLAPPPADTPPPADPNDDDDKAGEARVQIVTWIDKWDRFEKSGGLEEADVPTLKTLEEFHRNTLDRITRRLKSAR